MDIPVIETPRLRLRAFKLADLDAYAAMYAQESFVRYIGGSTLSRDQVWRSMSILLGHWQLLGYGLWAIEHRETGELMGHAGLLNLPGWPDIEVAWALGPAFWGHGYATEAARAAIGWAFGELGLERLISLIDPENTASEAVARRIGESRLEQITFHEKHAWVYEIRRDADS
jgi:RimJ/RimL family protein N-acetyltransferase